MSSLEEQIVVFLDLLGFSDRMRRAGGSSEDANALLLEYDRVMTPALKVFEEEHHDLYQFKGFTDNFVLAAPLRGGLHPEERFGTLLREIADFQLRLALDGWFVRGGVAVGSFFMDRRLVYGPALLDAYDLESRVAREPRIVLSTECKNWVRSFLEFYMFKADAPQSLYILIDADGRAFVNYLDSVGADMSPKHAASLIARHKDQVEGALRSHKSAPDIWNKYRWVAEYHDFWVSQWLPGMDDLSISTDVLRRNPQFLYDYDLPKGFRIPWGVDGLGLDPDQGT